MPLTDKYPLAVAFIIGPVRQEDGSLRDAPIGTGFILNVPLSAETYVEYVVTASHVVASDRETAVRIRTKDGGTKDLPVTEWTHHPTADVALARFEADPDMHLLNVPSHSLRWPHISDWHPDLGDRVYYLGLLSVPGSQTLIDRNVPVVRSGTVAAMYQADIPVEWPGGEVRKFEAHLIDCRSHGGFSGSPCFFQRDDQPVGVHEGRPITGSITFLLGLISGHFDDFTEPRLRGDLAEQGSLKVRVNTGVGIVTPAERIVDVLEMPEFKDERERLKRQHAEKPQEAATLDSVEGEDEFERFEDLTRKLVNVSKDELDEKRKRHS